MWQEVVKMKPFLIHISGYNPILKTISTAFMAVCYILLHPNITLVNNFYICKLKIWDLVHVDFTPPLGNTPKCSFSEKLPRFHNPLFEGEKPRVSFSHSPAPRRKKLGELFRDSIREEREENLEESSENQSEKSKKSSGDNFGELKVIEDSVEEKKNLKSLNYHHRCLPRFSSFKGSLMEKRRNKKKKIHVKWYWKFGCFIMKIWKLSAIVILQVICLMMWWKP